MAADEQLRSVIDYILNSAGMEELGIIQEASERRAQDLNRVGLQGMNPQKMAQDMAQNIQSQVGFSKDMVKKMAQDFVSDIIRQKAPELSEAQIEELVTEWVPEGNAPKKGVDLPEDAVLKMVKQFVSYSNNTMSMADQMALKQEMPDWVNHYWSCFPERVCKLILVFLEDKIDGDTFWVEVKASLKK